MSKQKHSFQLPKINQSTQLQRIRSLETQYPELTIFRRSIRHFVRQCARQSYFCGPVLDVGCGYRTNEPEVCSSGMRDFYTLDVDATLRPDFACDASNMTPIPSNVFGSAVCTELLEHTENPSAVVGEIFRILKPGGALVLSVPFWVAIHQNRELNDYWRFTPQAIRLLLCNYELENLTTKGGVSKPKGIFAVGRKPTIG